jgi:hypothetical protein
MKKRHVYAAYIHQKIVLASHLSEDALSRSELLYTIFFEVLLEIAIPIAILMHAMGSKRAAMIEYEFSHWAKPPVSFYHLIDDLFTILGIDRV